jgi:hypothetical protein
MPIDVSFIGYFGPIIAFLIILIVSYVLLNKIFDERKVSNAVISFLIAAIFVSSAGIVEYTLTVIPWIALLMISLVLIIALLAFVGKTDGMAKGIQVTVLVIAGLVFIISAFIVFSDVLVPYLPGSGFGDGGTPRAIGFFDWLYSSRIAGAILLIVLGGLVAWVLVKGK